MTDISAEDFRTALSRFATGVTVMTTVAEDGPHGMTANSVTSVSLDPLLVLVCVERDTAMCDLVVEAGVFGLSILTAEQEGLSNRFADPDRPAGAAQFDGVSHSTSVCGVPVLDGSLAVLGCRVWRTYDGGDHLIVVGEVVDLELGESSDALIYFRSGYTTARPPEALRP